MPGVGTYASTRAVALALAVFVSSSVLQKGFLRGVRIDLVSLDWSWAGGCERILRMHIYVFCPGKGSLKGEQKLIHMNVSSPKCYVPDSSRFIVSAEITCSALHSTKNTAHSGDVTASRGSAPLKCWAWILLGARYST